MPAVIVGPPPRSEQMWQALNTHITRERQRKKQEQEADAEEERQRKERERQQKQDVMTLGETREQIVSLESELSQLKDEKHQLFLQLKKVLNEDDNRRRQLSKDTCVGPEALSGVGGYPGGGMSVVHPQLFLPLPARSPLYKVAVAAPTHNLMPNVNGPIKRSHSPSPPAPPLPPPQPLASPYHASYGYKPSPSVPSYNPPPPSHLRTDGYVFPESEDAARRSGDNRAVLWNSPNGVNGAITVNKNNQYPPSSFYSTPTQSVYSYTAPTSQPSREPEAGKTVYLSGNRAAISGHQPSTITPFSRYETIHTLDHKNAYSEDKFYLRPSSHVTVHGGAIPIQQPPQGAKTGGITSGYPVRAPQPPAGSYASQPPPPPAAPGTYVSTPGPNVSGRLMYSQSGARYLHRDG